MAIVHKNVNTETGSGKDLFGLDYDANQNKVQ